MVLKPAQITHKCSASMNWCLHFGGPRPTAQDLNPSYVKIGPLHKLTTSGLDCEHKGQKEHTSGLRRNDTFHQGCNGKLIELAFAMKARPQRAYSRNIDGATQARTREPWAPNHASIIVQLREGDLHFPRVWDKNFWSALDEFGAAAPCKI